MKAQIDIVASEPNIEKKYQLVTVNGEIDRDTIVKFRESIEEIVKNFQQSYLLLDFAKLDFINSEGIGFLSDLQNRFKTDNKAIMVLRASDRIMDIFQLVGLNQVIICCDSEDECLAAVNKES